MNVPFFIRHPRRVSKKKNTRRGLIGTRDLESKARAKPECRWSLSSPSKLIMKPLARSKSFLILLLISVRGKRERNKERENVLSSRYRSFSLYLSFLSPSLSDPPLFLLPSGEDDDRESKLSARRTKS